MTKEEFAIELVNIFPGAKVLLDEHYSDYGDLLGHVFLQMQ